ncbi:MAG: enoyl-CoA hydratase/isomerase family protein [Fimbriiglobus sp.]
MTDLVLYSHMEPAALLTLNRPDKRNALSRELIAALADAFRRAADDPAARCVILTGAGPAFCAGMDLDEVRTTTDADAVLADARTLSALVEQIFTFPKPTIAAVNGAAIAGGCGLVTVCDLAVTVPTAKYGYPEVRRGLVAAMVMPHLLRHVGERAARWLLLTGELIDGVDAQQIGLVNAVRSPETLLPAAILSATAIAAGGPAALTATKSLLSRCASPGISADDLTRASAEPRTSAEGRAGLAAFFENRPAPWVPPHAR